VRWQHPKEGLISPGRFIAIAEQSDLIVELSTYIFREACQLLARMQSVNIDARLSINLSPRHFRKHNFVPWLKALLLETGADPHHLTLEITEGLFIDNLLETSARMNELCALGIHFSIDDFGTGYSSLAYLKRLPIKELKIDRGFIQDAPSHPDDAALVDAILAVAQKLNLEVVAEGIETAEQAEFLSCRGRIIRQGYLFGRPEPAESWLKQWSANV
jgi:EAL domain-containing protein (putative c-di-GMP-specific phosphodiesterase class I)